MEKNGLRYYQFEIFQDQPMFHAVLTRHGGFSQPPYDSLNTGGTVGDDIWAVLRNHQLIYRKFGYEFFSRFDVWQVHSNKVICTDAPRHPDTPHAKADGIMTDNPEVTLFMRFADCVPILLLDPVKKVIGIVHAGWQGTYKKIAQVAIEKMALRYGSMPDTLLAGIGPSICQECYEVGENVLQEFKNNLGQKAQQFFKHLGSKLYLDLWQSNLFILQSAGVRKIEISGICTACHLEDWYSHRAENGKTGRFGVLMSIQDI